MIYPATLNINDPFFGYLPDDGSTARQMALVALNTPPNFLDAFPEYGYVFDDQILRALGQTDLALLPLEVRGGLEAEPSFVSVAVGTAQTQQLGSGAASLALPIQITAADGSTTGFTVGSSS